MAKKQSEDQVSAESAEQVVSMTLTQFMEAVRAAGVGGGGNDKMADAILQLVKDQTRGVRPENAVNPRISEFSYPEGEEARPKPRLTRETFFCGVKQSEEQLMPLEIDLFNAIDGTKVARKGAWVADVEQPKGGSRGRLLVTVPARNADDIAGLPPLAQILTELATGQSATDVTKLMQQVADMQAQLAKLTSGETVTV